MFCSNCGTEVPEGANNCPNCGAPIWFGEHAFVHRARLHQGRQFLNGIVRPVDALEIPGLRQHGVAMRGLRLQGGGADQQGGGQQAAFHFFLEVNSTTP